MVTLRFHVVGVGRAASPPGRWGSGQRSGGGPVRRTARPGCCHTVVFHLVRGGCSVVGVAVVPASATVRAGGAQPCRCLWRGLSQITRTRPCRRMTLHLSHIFLTLGWTFIEGLSGSSARDAPALPLGQQPGSHCWVGRGFVRVAVRRFRTRWCGGSGWPGPTHRCRKTMRPRVRSYGESSTTTRSDGRMRM